MRLTNEFMRLALTECVALPSPLRDACGEGSPPSSRRTFKLNDDERAQTPRPQRKRARRGAPFVIRD